MRSSKYQVRLFPAVHITSDGEAELRATASLLSCVLAVSEFGKAIVRGAGGPAGTFECFTERPYSLNRGTGKTPEELRPDGLIRVRRGKTNWSAFIEVKVGNSQLDSEQIDKYHQLAREHGVNAVITVSNQVASPDGLPPIEIDRRRLRSIPIVHFSWERLLSEAQVLRRMPKGVSDIDQKWILDEWVRYVDDPAARIMTAPSLGPEWHSVLKVVKTGDLTDKDPALASVAEHWRGFMQRAALKLRARLGADVRVQLPRKERADRALYLDRLVKEAASKRRFSDALRVPGAVGDIEILLDLPSRTTLYSVAFPAPNSGRQATRVNWLAKQLRAILIRLERERDARAKLEGIPLTRLEPAFPSELEVIVSWDARGVQTRTKVSTFLEDPDSLLRGLKGAPLDRSLCPKAFTLNWSKKLPRGRSSAPVVDSISSGLLRFYGSVVEHLVPAIKRAPQLKNDSDLEGDSSGASISGASASD